MVVGGCGAELEVLTVVVLLIVEVGMLEEGIFALVEAMLDEEPFALVDAGTLVEELCRLVADDTCEDLLAEEELVEDALLLVDDDDALEPDENGLVLDDEAGLVLLVLFELDADRDVEAGREVDTDVDLLELGVEVFPAELDVFFVEATDDDEP